jgi:hypothetical protein
MPKISEDLPDSKFMKVQNCIQKSKKYDSDLEKKMKGILKSQRLKLHCTQHFTMSNNDLRSFLLKNRHFVDLYKMSYQKQSYADSWLALKFFEYNSLLDEIRDQYKQVSKNINCNERERADLRDEFLEESITPKIYKIIFGRDQSKDANVDSNESAYMLSMLQQDEESSQSTSLNIGIKSLKNHTRGQFSFAIEIMPEGQESLKSRRT